MTKIVRDGENPIRVQVLDEPELEADFVLVTCSLGVLKARAETLFEPALPERKLEAIRKIEIGSVDKIFLEFEDAWWAQQDIGTGFAFMYSESGNEKFRKKILDGDDFYHRNIVIKMNLFSRFSHERLWIHERSR